MDVVILHAGGYQYSLFNIIRFYFSLMLLLIGYIICVCNIYYSIFRDASTIGLIKVRDTYPFGVDPKWHGTRSELPFLNSLKMKMSILLGVSQMNLGIIMSYYNAKYFENDINIW